MKMTAVGPNLMSKEGKGEIPIPEGFWEITESSESLLTGLGKKGYQWTLLHAVIPQKGMLIGFAQSFDRAYSRMGNLGTII